MKPAIPVLVWIALMLVLPLDLFAQHEDSSAAAEAEALGLEIPDRLAAREDPAGEGSLRGLQGVCVVIQDLDPLVEKEGLDKHRLYLWVALELTRGGLNIVPPERYEEFEDTAFLFVSLHTLNINGLTFAYKLGLSLSQDVSLLRDSEVLASATTWRSEELGIMEYGKVGDLMDSVKAKAEEFVQAYLAENSPE